jgi:hypothetical protein
MTQSVNNNNNVPLTAKNPQSTATSTSWWSSIFGRSAPIPELHEDDFIDFKTEDDTASPSKVDSDLSEESFVEITVDRQPSKPINTLIQSIRNIFKSVFFQDATDAVLSSNLHGSVKVDLSSGLKVSANVTLFEKVTCDIKVVFSKTASGKETLEVKEFHPFFTKLLEGEKIAGQIKDLNELKEVLQAIPHQKASIEWLGSEKTAVVIMQLPGSTRIEIAINFPKGLAKIAEDLPFILAEMIPGAFHKLLPGLLPLLNENFRFEWNGETRQFALEFESCEYIKIENLTLVETGFIATLAKQFGNWVSMKLPQRIAGTIHPTEQLIEFEKDTTFRIKFGKHLGKEVILIKASYDENEVKLGLNTHKEVIDLKTSRVKDVGITFATKPSSKRPYSKSMLEFNAQDPSDCAPNPILEKLKSTLLSKAPVEYQSFLSKLLAAPLNVDVTFSLQNSQSITATIQLPDDMSCKVDLTIPTDSKPHGKVNIDKKIMNQLSAKLDEHKEDYHIEQIVALVASLPTLDVNLHWNGTTGTVNLGIDLPGGANFKIELKAPQLMGKGVQDLPPVLTTLFSKLPQYVQIEQLFNSIRPLISSNFHLNWNGANSTFKLGFDEQQQVHIKSVKLPEKGFLDFMKTFIGENSFIRLPKQIQAAVDLEKSIFKFSPEIKLNFKSGILVKDIDLTQVSYDADGKIIRVDYRCFGKKSELIDMNESKPEKGEVKIYYVIGPVPNK